MVNRRVPLLIGRLFRIVGLIHEAISIAQKTSKLIFLESVVAVHVSPACPTSRYLICALLHNLSVLILQSQHGRQDERKGHIEVIVHFGRVWEYWSGCTDTKRVALTYLIVALVLFFGLFCVGVRVIWSCPALWIAHVGWLGSLWTKGRGPIRSLLLFLSVLISFWLGLSWSLFEAAYCCHYITRNIT